jgi:carboxypeptidase D
VTQNALIDAGQLSGAHHIDLHTVLIGNGWYDPIIQYEAYYNYTVYPGNTYGIEYKNPVTRWKMYNGMYGEGNCLDMSYKCRYTGRDDICSAADNFCYQEVEYIEDLYLGRNEYDMRELDPDPFPYNFYPAYLNTPRVQQAIGAFVNFSDYNDVVGTRAFGNTGDDDRTQGAVGACRKLINQGIYMVQFNGDADYNCA